MFDNPSPTFTVGQKEDPKPLHIALYPDYKSRGDILQYLRSTKLTGWPHQSTSLLDLHCTILYSGSLVLPSDFPKEQVLGNPINLTGIKWPVKPLALGLAKVGTAVAVLFPRVERIKHLSDLMHKRFKLTPNPATYISHVTLSKIQMFPRNSKQYEMSPFKSITDYYHLPPYTGRMVFDTLKVSYDYS